MVGWLAQEGGTIEAVFGSSEKAALWVIFGISIVALLFAWYLVREVLSAPEGTPKMREIAQAIQEGAKAYLVSSVPDGGCVPGRADGRAVLPVAGAGHRRALRVLDQVRTFGSRSSLVPGSRRSPGTWDVARRARERAHGERRA
jgi:hypothetical protein